MKIRWLNKIVPSGYRVTEFFIIQGWMVELRYTGSNCILSFSFRSLNFEFISDDSCILRAFAENAFCKITRRWPHTNLTDSRTITPCKNSHVIVNYRSKKINIRYRNKNVEVSYDLKGTSVENFRIDVYTERMFYVVKKYENYLAK